MTQKKPRKPKKPKKPRQSKRKGQAKKARDERQVELLPGPTDGDSRESLTEDAPAAGRLSGQTSPPLRPSAPPPGASVAQPDASVPPPNLSVPPPASPSPPPGPRALEPSEGADPPVSVEEAVRPAGNELARARDLVEDGRVHEAIDLYREIVSQKPDSVRAHNNIGVLFDELGQHESAVEHFEEALRLEPDHVEVLTNYGSALTALARYDAAELALRRSIRLAPDDFAARLAVGVLSFRRGLYTQAELELRWVCEHDSENGRAFYYRAEALNRLDRFDEALPLMERAAELMPGDQRPFYSLGHLYDRKGLRPEAEEMFREARELQSP